MSCAMPEIGSLISLISKAGIRYEGSLFTVDPDRCTIALARVKSFGTEDRETQFPIAPQSQCYDYILFRGSDIQDIRVINNCSMPTDPAIMQMGPPQKPSIPQPMYQQPGGFLGLGGPMTGPPPPMGQYNQFGGMNNLGGMSSNDMVKNPFPGLNLINKPNEISNIIPPSVSEQAPLAPSQTLATASEPNDQASVLDMIGGSRSTTPSNLLSRKSPTSDMAVQTNQMQNNSRDNNNRSGDSGGSAARTNNEQRNNQQRPNQQRNNNQQRERRDSGKMADNQSNNKHLMQRQGNNNQNRGWNNNRNNYQNHQNHQNHHNQQNHQNHQNQNNMRGRPRGRGSSSQGNRSKNTLKFENDYDFEQANNKFEELRSQLSKLKVGDEVKPEQVATDNLDKKDDSGNETGAGEHEQEEEEVCYDKTKSFFDTISCEAVERQKGKSHRTDWRQERKLNSETFGVSSTRRGGNYYSYRGRGGGGYYNRGPNFRGSYNNGGNNYRGGNYRGRSGNGNRSNNMMGNHQNSNGLPQRSLSQPQPPQQPQQQQQQQQPAVIAVAAGK